MNNLNYHQTLLTPNKSKTTQKIIFFSIALVTLISLAYLGILNIQPNNQATTLSNNNNNNARTTSLNTDNTRKILWKTLSTHILDINEIIYVSKKIRRNNNNIVQPTSRVQAVDDCLELLDLSRDRISDFIKTLSNYNNNDNIRTWLSAVLTNHVTCMDQIENDPNLLGLKSRLEDLITRARVILEIHSKMTSPGILTRGRVTSSSYPRWIRKSDKKLLGVLGIEIAADLVVAKDGSGNFTTVGEAVAAVPDKGKKRFVIYVKEGVYVENVEVGKKKKNVMMIGDGMNVSVISGSENVVDGNTTFKSATLAAVGDGFILQDMGIQNTAGPEKHQAVALRVGSDKSVINRCQIDAYQDTLYTHSLRQFYTYSSISGTVDFIFGNAAVVFQNCQLIARKPMTSQKNMVTAQGRTDPNQNTGTSIQYCDIIPEPALEPVISKFPTFLGRPWKNFSRTVVMQSNIGDHIDPTGWAPWDGGFALDTLYYGEYLNYGPGSGTDKRVNWTGYHVIDDITEAKQFTVGDFIQGQEWLDEAGVNFVEGL